MFKEASPLRTQHLSGFYAKFKSKINTQNFPWLVPGSEGNVNFTVLRFALVQVRMRTWAPCLLTWQESQISPESPEEFCSKHSIFCPVNESLPAELPDSDHNPQSMSRKH